MPTDEENIFSLNISEKNVVEIRKVENEVENVKFSKSLEYKVTGLTINPDPSSFTTIKRLDKVKLKVLSKKIQDLAKKIKEPNLDLLISHSETKNVVIPFQKKKKRKKEKECPALNLLILTQQLKKMRKFCSIITKNT